jgi:Arc/MetJ-type ribon-helix-helix transcriptional regulator
MRREAKPVTIEIHTPELERRVREDIKSGRFGDMDDLLGRALDALQEVDKSIGTPGADKAPGIVEALTSPPFLHSELYIPPRQKEYPRPADL